MSRAAPGAPAPPQVRRRRAGPRARAPASARGKARRPAAPPPARASAARAVRDQRARPAAAIRASSASNQAGVAHAVPDQPVALAQRRGRRPAPPRRGRGSGSASPGRGSAAARPARLEPQPVHRRRQPQHPQHAAAAPSGVAALPSISTAAPAARAAGRRPRGAPSGPAISAPAATQPDRPAARQLLAAARRAGRVRATAATPPRSDWSCRRRSARRAPPGRAVERELGAARSERNARAGDERGVTAERRRHTRIGITT